MQAAAATNRSIILSLSLPINLHQGLASKEPRDAQAVASALHALGRRRRGLGQDSDLPKVQVGSICCLEVANKQASKLVFAFVGAEKEVGWRGSRM